MILQKKKQKIVFGIIFIIVVSFLCYFIFLIKINYKKSNNGNNILNKTLDEIQEYICNITSYEATMEVTINSNKNINKYIIKQSHNEKEDIQEIIEPENVKGIRLIYKDNTLKIENTKLNLSKIYNNYPYIEDNNLWLNDFIEEYKKIDINEKEIMEDNEKIILKIEVQDSKSNIKYKELYLDKKTVKPTELLLKDNNKNIIMYILYNEITIK